jgi:hypothetical protein
VQHCSRHRHRIVQEDAEIAHSAKLRRETKPVMVTALLCDQSVVGIVQMKIAGQILGRRYSAVTTVVFTLCGGEEADGHLDLPWQQALAEKWKAITLNATSFVKAAEWPPGPVELTRHALSQCDYKLPL